MNIGIISSWGSKCGISEYTGNLVEGLRADKNNHVKVCANYLNKECQAFDQIDEPFVKRLFHCPFMTKETTADVDGMIEHLKDSDVVHIQFETSLYHPSWFPELIQKINKPIIFTMHSSGIWPGFNFDKIKTFISHSPSWCNIVIPMGVKNFSDIEPEPNGPDICSFGLGRNNDDWVKSALKDTTHTYRTSYGNSKWIGSYDLYKFINSSKVISLLYPEVGADVSSSAVIFAMGVDRPVLITPTKWFSDFINYPGLYICRDIPELKENITYLLDPKNTEEITEDLRQRRQKLESDGRTFERFIERTINVYKSLI